tara:strand:- start:339 stop:791 length:453 start_codon:yes stop_codon:yes gene_type:complete
MKAVPAKYFAFGPYRAESLGGDRGWWGVINRSGVNCLTFPDKLGAVVTTEENAKQIADEWNETKGTSHKCPDGLIKFACEVEGVDLVCFLEYSPAELGSKDSLGLAYEPDQDESMDLVNAYITGTDVDIAHLLMQSLVDHITTTALEDLK